MRDNENKGFPRYQWSEFIKSGGRDGQMVIRSNDKTEFEEDKRYLDKIVEKYRQPEEQKKTIHTEPEQTRPSTDWLEESKRENFCSIHKKEMTEKNGRYGVFYSHWLGKDQSGKSTYCNGKPK